MFNLKWKHLGLTVVLLLSLLLAACGSNDEDAGNGNDDGDDNEVTESVSEQLDYTITGIEPGSGVVGSAEEATEVYDSLAGWEVATSSSGAMATALSEAIANEEPIIVTGWTPHWKFAKFDLKYLDDPEKVFGDEEVIKTMVREGLEDEKPNAYKVLDQFNWTAADMESVMLEIQNGADEAEAAQNWIDNNQDKVAEWTEGVEDVDGVKVELVYVLWDSEIASTNVVAKVLESKGFDVTITSVENAAMWESVATGNTDGMVAAWLPGTHGDLYAQFQDDLVDLGENLTGAKIGLVVPSYMDVDSIEDLQPNE
ncbi:glycine betaine ABC transporter substrate-binding protein [Salirhabdus salicampi]|uniref:glycine betaine ABC transporter substrate-binding protein n=1 Tax=Salirhabdus salicampi TaxID=476102 RepID=UPI0020C3E749|nr:glycine betaine ABC transporter substrate-binding protein [Salirhabdus salicampi]MCP8615510.1 glycine/betaine ABC transporter [Salirhabdus salicampi]